MSFEEVPQPLEVKPWDINFEAASRAKVMVKTCEDSAMAPGQEVVSNWLQAAQRSQNLQPSLVRCALHPRMVNPGHLALGLFAMVSVESQRMHFESCPDEIPAELREHV